MKESDMFEPVKAMLIRKGFNTVVAEVWNADVVAFNDAGEEVIVEMKKTLNFKVLEQIFAHRGNAKYMYIAIPLGKHRFNPNHRFAYFILQEYGIGLIYVPDGEKSRGHAYVEIDSAEHHVEHSIRKAVQPHHYLAVGGVKSGETVTAYSMTRDKVKKYMQEREDWVTVDEILKYVETHWANPKASLAADLRATYNRNWCEWKPFGRGTVYRFKEGTN